MPDDSTQSRLWRLVRYVPLVLLILGGAFYFFRAGLLDHNLSYSEKIYRAAAVYHAETGAALTDCWAVEAAEAKRTFRVYCAAEGADGDARRAYHVDRWGNVSRAGLMDLGPEVLQNPSRTAIEGPET